MKKLLFILLLFSSTAYGQIFPLVFRTPAANGCSLFLDDYSGATAAYSFRKLDCQYAGSSIRVRRSSDNAESDIGFTAGDDLDTAALKTFVGTGGSDDGFIVTWYDQSGSANDATQATGGSQPKIMDNGVIYREGTNNKPTATYASSFFGLTSNLASNSNFSIYSVQSRSNTGNRGVGLSNSGNSQPFSAYPFTDGNIYLADGTNYIGYAYLLAALGLLESYSISATLSIYNNGAAMIGGIGGALGGAAVFNAIGNRGGSEFMMGNIQEMIYYPSDKSSTRAAMASNINAYYGIY